MLRRIWRMAGMFGLAASAMSLATLIFQGFQLGVAEPVRMMLSYYEGLLQFALGWAHAPIVHLAGLVRSWIGLPLQPAPEWKHVFVLVWLYFSCDARSSLLQNRQITASATLVFGFAVSVAAIIASGGIQSTSSADLLIAVGTPLAGFLLHAIMESLLTVVFYREPTRSVAHSIRYYLLTEVLSAAIAGAAACGAAVATAPAVGTSWAVIAALSCFVLVRGGYWLLRGVYLGVTDRSPGEAWYRRFARSGSGQFGMLIYAVVAGALLFVALNAGLTV